MKNLLTVLKLILVPTLVLGQPSSSKYSQLLTLGIKANSDALVVLEDGEKMVEYYSDSKSKKIESMSVTKSVVGLAFAKLLSDGKIDSLNTPVAHYYPEWRQGQKDKITIRHLMSHTSGLQNVANANAEVNPAPDVLKLGLCASVEDEPGTEFSYNNKALNILPGILKKVVGKPIDKYLKAELFNPLGINDFSWGTDEAGNHYGMGGLGIHPRDLAKLGQLVLQKGSWDGKQLIDQEWIEKLLAQGPPETRTYGLLWWRIPKGQKYIIGDQQINELKQAGINKKMVAKVENIKGTYSNLGSLQNAFMSEFGSKKQFMRFRKAIMAKELSPYKKSMTGPTIGYKASGDGGQYLVIFPKQDIVAVRMIEMTENYNPKTDSFSNFARMVYKLSKTH